MITWLKEKLNKLLLWMYMQTWILAILWTIFMIVLTILYNYYDCTKKLTVLSLETIATTVLTLFTINILIILGYTLRQKSIINRNIKNGKNNEKVLESVDITEGADKLDHYIVTQNYLNVLPLYIITIYALSKIIIYMVYFFSNRKKYIIAIDSIGIWIALLLGTGWLWLSLKKYAHKEAQYSIKYTIFIGVITWLSLYWTTLIPYFIDISMLSKCIATNF